MRVVLRDADEGDSLFVLEVRNDADARRNSRNSELISEADHQVWFERVLADPRRHVLIGTSGGVPVGYVRFDETERPGSAEVSIALAPNFRGQGLARGMLADAVAFWLARGGRSLVAFVQVENTQSARLFRELDFIRVDGSDGWDQYELQIGEVDVE